MNLCDQTVTVYHPENGQVRRWVVEGCYFHRYEEEKNDLLGQRLETCFLLILPEEAEQRIFIGDRVCEGHGPEVTWAQWQQFLPVLVPGVAEAAYVRVIPLENGLCHVEAGRK